MDLLKNIKIKAKHLLATIIVPEADEDKRVYNACKFVLKNKLANLIVFGKSENFDKTFKHSNCKIIDIDILDKRKFVKQLYTLRKHKGLTMQEAEEYIKDRMYLATLMLKNDYADGLVAGATVTTAQVLKPALQIIKAKKNKTIVTGSMILLKKGKEPLIFGDVSLIENPSKEQLGEIALSNADFMHNNLGLTPKVAMLSYSTFGSAKSEMTKKVADACAIAKQKSNFVIDGEMQFDSAFHLPTALKKCPNSKIRGDANVFVFPDLNAGNIGYKIASKLGGYTAVGPVLLNFNKPVNDLSRGSTTEEIINTICLTAIMSQT